MPRHIALVALALCAAPAAPAAAQDDPVLASRAAYQDAVRAYQAHDVPAFLRYATEAQRLRPAHGGTTYALASAYTMAGDTGAALAMLRRFAALGYNADVAADSDFVVLRGTAAFDGIRRALSRNAAPLARGTPAFTLPERDLLTEGIAYDPAGRSFFVGSVHRRKILRVDRHGRFTEFVPPGSGGLWAPLGMRVDPIRRVLWVAAAALPQMADFDPADGLRSGLFRFDLSGGALTGRFLLPADGASHTLGDITVTRGGDVFATDSRGPVIYRVRAGADSLERFLESPLLLSAQGLALDAAERTLYVADYARGILRVDLASREVRLMEVDEDVLALGIDGLAVGRSLVGIRTASPRIVVVRLRLDARGDRIVSVEVSSAPVPTTRSRRSASWSATSFLRGEQPVRRFREDGIDAPEELRAPLVLRLRL
jgi:sugar lactone lactonase YvrE